MNDCLFCKIITGEIPSAKIYENKSSFAFLDINPINHGHVLLIPKKHSRNIFDTDDEVLKQLAPTLKKLSTAVKDGVGADGINIHINNEPAAGQVIFHTHIHIIPRFESDNIKPWEGVEYKQNEINKIAEKIKNMI